MWVCEWDWEKKWVFRLWVCECVCKCESVCMNVCVNVKVCVCGCVNEIERNSECLDYECACVCVCVYKCESVCMNVCERQREREEWDKWVLVSFLSNALSLFHFLLSGNSRE
jgi:hypothetical protein